MAKIKGGTKGGLNDSLFRETISEIVSPVDSGKVVDIVEFTKSPWGLNIDLTPVQRFMIKALYGLPMDATHAYIEIPDVLNSRRLYEPMTEVEFAKWSYEEGRCNIDFSDPNNWGRDFYNFVMALGRRSGKCRNENDLIHTTLGSISFKELLKRKSNKEKIGIQTYNPETLNKSITYDFKIWSNGIKKCLNIKTKTGYCESSTENHPYLIKRNNDFKFINVSDIKVGDKIAVSKNINLFGKNNIGLNKAKLLGYFFAEESVLSHLEFNNINLKSKEEIEGLLNSEFPNCVLNSIEMLKENQHQVFELDFDEKYNLENWLKKIGCFTLKNKKVPKCIFEGSKGEISSFVSAIFNCDGFFREQNGLYYVGIKSSCSDFLIDLKHLLLKFGIFSEIKDDEIKIINKKYISLFISNFDSYNRIDINKTKELEEDCFGDIIWDTVVFIGDSGENNTVDLCVDDTHIIGGDIVSHNSTICSCIVDYEFYRLFKNGDPHKMYNVPPGQEIAVIGTAPTDGQAQIVFNMAKTFCQNSPIMRDRVAHPTQTYFEVQTDADIKQFGKGKEGSMQFITGGSSSNSIRGHNAIIVLIDEMAFFNETGNRFSIDEVYGALTPSIAKFKNPESGHMDGKIICLSSPYAHFGKFYDLYRDSFSDESSKFGKTVSFKYYTALVNPGNASEEYLREERRKDRAKFRREFEAEFDERITAWIDSEVQFRNNIKRPYQNETGQRGVKYFYGFDFGSTDNGAAISVVHKEDEVYYLDYSEVFYPKTSPIWEATVCTLYREHQECGRFREFDVLPLFEIGDYIKKISNKYPMFSGVIDQYSGHAIFQILMSKGIENIDLKSYNESSKSRVFKLIKELYQENLLNLMDHPVLIQEMLNMEAELRPGNKIAVNKRSSADNSYQDDITDSFVRAVWECWNYYNISGNKSGKGKSPVMVSFGNGNPININNGSNSYDISNKLKSLKSVRDFNRIKGQIHGIDTKRTPKKGKFK